MTQRALPSLRVAVADVARRSAVLAEALRNQGHDVVTHSSRQEFLAAPEADACIVGSQLEDGTSGLDLGEELRRLGRSAPLVLVDESPTYEVMQRAVRLGVADLVLAPLAPGALRAAMERCLAQRRPGPRPDLAQPHTCARVYELEDGVSGRVAREISGFLANEGIVAAHRVRIASAVAELVDNAHRHSRARDGKVTVNCEIVGNRVRLEIQDRGCGFDAQRARLDRVPAALPAGRSDASPSSTSGLGRVELLSESLHIDSNDNGTRLELGFQLTPVRFDEEAESLADTEFLDPTSARTLIASLRRGNADLSGVSAPLAMTIGRIIGGVTVQVPGRSS